MSKPDLYKKDNPGELIEIKIRARVKRGQIKAFVGHVISEMDVCRDECNEIYGAEIEYTHWV